MNRREFLKGMVATGVVASGIGIACGGENDTGIFAMRLGADAGPCCQEDSLDDAKSRKFFERGKEYALRNNLFETETGVFWWDDDLAVNLTGYVPVCGNDEKPYGTIERLICLPDDVFRIKVSKCDDESEKVNQLLTQVGKYLITHEDSYETLGTVVHNV